MGQIVIQSHIGQIVIFFLLLAFFFFLKTCGGGREKPGSFGSNCHAYLIAGL
jgi:hypothetical protein